MSLKPKVQVQFLYCKNKNDNIKGLITPVTFLLKALQQLSASQNGGSSISLPRCRRQRDLSRADLLAGLAPASFLPLRTDRGTSVPRSPSLACLNSSCPYLSFLRDPSLPPGLRRDPPGQESQTTVLFLPRFCHSTVSSLFLFAHLMSNFSCPHQGGSGLGGMETVGKLPPAVQLALDEELPRSTCLW